MFWNLQTNMSASWSVNSQMNLAELIWMSEAISYDPAGIWWQDGINIPLTINEMLILKVGKAYRVALW